MRSLITLLLISISFSLQAQLYCPPLAGKVGKVNRFHVTAGYGITKTYGDIEYNAALGSAGYLRLDYSIRNGFLIGLEGRFGTLISEGETGVDPRYSRNEFLAGGLMVTVHPVALFNPDSKLLPSFSALLAESFFVEVGVLGMRNRYDKIYRNLNLPYTYGVLNRYDENNDPIFKNETRALLLPSLSAGMAIPINKGYNIKGRYVSIVPKAQINFSNNDNLDGYNPYDNDGYLVDGGRDIYTYYSLGVRYSF